MRVTTRLVVDMRHPLPDGKFRVIAHEWFEYSGPVGLCKGDGTASSTEASTAAFTNTLQQAFQTQFATQQNTLNFLNSSLQKQVNNPQGYSPQTLAAMRTSSADQTAAANQNAQRSAQNQEFNEGGQDNPSGVNAQINASIASEAGRANAENQQQITESNAALQNQNYWNGVQGEEGIAAQENGTGTAGAANGAAGTVAGLSQAVTAANGPSIGSILGGVATGIGGATIGAAGKAGGFSSLFS